MTRRAYSFVTLKALDDGNRTLEGWASRPSVDRAGDICEPRGARFRLPLPLLVDHRHEAAVGEVFEAKVSDDGIRFKAKIAKIATPGAVKELCDDAWAMVRAGLRKAVSVGFRPIEAEPIATGVRFRSWDWFELSLCSVPCQAGATIDQIKALDAKRGRPLPVVKLDAPLIGRKAKPTPMLGRPIADAVVKATEQVRRTLEISRDLGGEAAVTLTALAAATKATDNELADLHARLAKLERM